MVLVVDSEPSEILVTADLRDEARDTVRETVRTTVATLHLSESFLVMTL